jgi:hypothetical protein
MLPWTAIIQISLQFNSLHVFDINMRICKITDKRIIYKKASGNENQLQEALLGQ